MLSAPFEKVSRAMEAIRTFFGAQPIRLRSPGLKQQPYADCQRNEPEKPSPTVWYGENSQRSGRTDAQDGRETEVAFRLRSFGLVPRAPEKGPDCGWESQASLLAMTFEQFRESLEHPTRRLA
jgi:hypothetical protein